MIFDEGNIIFRNGEKLTITVRKDEFCYLESISDKTNIHKLMINDLVEEYMDGEIHIDGYDSPIGKQVELSDKHWEKINYRKFFAIAFNRQSTPRYRVQAKIRRIARLMNLPPKNIPARASCYRWAKLLREANGDITVLR